MDVLLTTQKLAFFHADFGKEFPSRTLWEVHPESAALQDLCCAFSLRAEHFSSGRTGWKGAQKRGEERWPAEGEKGMRENRSENTERIEVTQKWPKSDSWGPTLKWSQLTQKLLKMGSSVTFFANFRSLWGRSAPVTFESLCGNNFFCVSV